MKYRAFGAVKIIAGISLEVGSDSGLGAVMLARRLVKESVTAVANNPLITLVTREVSLDEDSFDVTEINEEEVLRRVIAEQQERIKELEAQLSRAEDTVWWED